MKSLRSQRLTYIILIVLLSLVLAMLCVALTLMSRSNANHPTQPPILQQPTTGMRPGTTTTLPGTTVTLPGTTVTIPGTTATIPGTTIPVPGTTVTIPGTTVTIPTEPTNPTTMPTVPVTTTPTAPTTTPTTAPTEPKEPVDVDAFFAESAFIGDSVTLALRNYCLKDKQALGGATILCAGSYSVRHALATPGGKLEGWDVVSITYQGEKMRPEDALAACGVKRVFIMLGLNDIALVGIDKTISNWGKLIANIRKTCPDIEIYIQSGTPILIGGEQGSLKNPLMDSYNVRLEQFCQENGCFFVNVSETLKDDNGGLKKAYCSDGFCHLTESGVKAWIAYLRDYAAAQHG